MFALNRGQIQHSSAPMPMTSTSRLYHCTVCHCQVVICSRCDRGNIYCSGCAYKASREARKRATMRYQASHKGRLNNARRQRAYRARVRLVGRNDNPDCKIVTHKGSPPTPLGVPLPVQPFQRQDLQKPVIRQARNCFHCHFCSGLCSDYFRSSFLRRSHRLYAGSKP